MGNLLVSGLQYAILQGFVLPILHFVGTLLGSLAGVSQTLENEPIVTTLSGVVWAITGGLMALAFGWKALSGYVLWSEGSSNDIGGTLVKPLFRAGFYALAGGWLAKNVFQFGIWWGLAFVAAPFKTTFTTLGYWGDSLGGGLSAVGVGTILFATIALAVCAVLITIVLFSMAVRAIEMVYYLVAAPVMALGWISDPQGGGIWSSWWRQLVVLSLSTAWQYMAFALLSAILTQSIFGISAHALHLTGNWSMGILLAVACSWVALRGPHLLTQWSYHSGGGSAAGQVAGQLVRNKLSK